MEKKDHQDKEASGLCGACEMIPLWLAKFWWIVALLVGVANGIVIKTMLDRRKK